MRFHRRRWRWWRQLFGVGGVGVLGGYDANLGGASSHDISWLRYVDTMGGWMQSDFRYLRPDVSKRGPMNLYSSVLVSLYLSQMEEGLSENEP